MHGLQRNLRKKRFLQKIAEGLRRIRHKAAILVHVESSDSGDPKLVKLVELDPLCRRQQVNDGCFCSLDFNILI